MKRRLAVALAAIAALAGSFGLGATVNDTTSPPVSPARLADTTVTAEAKLMPGCVWADGTKALNLIVAVTAGWHFQNADTVGRTLKWVGGSHYATDQGWNVRPGDGLTFTQAVTTKSTWTTCGGTVKLTVTAA